MCACLHFYKLVFVQFHKFAQFLVVVNGIELATQVSVRAFHATDTTTAPNKGILRSGFDYVATMIAAYGITHYLGHKNAPIDNYTAPLTQGELYLVSVFVQSNAPFT